MAPREIEQIADRLEGLIARLEGRFGREHRCREAEYRRLLQEVVEVLLSTRHAFHSNRLKGLRERIEAVLRQEVGGRK